MSTIPRTKTRPSRLEALAAFFIARPNSWQSALDVMPIGGTLSWRSRVADLRRPPWNLNIRNRQRMVRRPDGTKVLISEYRNEVQEVEQRREAGGGASTPLLF